MSKLVPNNRWGFVDPVTIGVLIAIGFGYALGYAFTAGEAYPGQAAHSYQEPREGAK